MAKGKNSSCPTSDTAGIAIRKACPEDLSAIVGLAKELSKSESIMDPMITPVSRFQDPEWILKNIEKDNAVVFVATFNNEVVGYVLGWVSQPWDYKFERGYICDCFVKEDYRRRGVGKALCREILKWFRSKNINCVEADIYTNNVASIKLFRSLGFEEVAKKFRLTFK
ncbi:MAG: GNAT family N-acetyltransferase [Candidatus Bathyarchaeia archaeon]